MQFSTTAEELHAAASEHDATHRDDGDFANGAPDDSYLDTHPDEGPEDRYLDAHFEAMHEISDHDDGEFFGT